MFIYENQTINRIKAIVRKAELDGTIVRKAELDGTIVRKAKLDGSIARINKS